MVGQGTLYSFRRCPYAIRARIALAASGVELEVREILLSQKPIEFLELSPKGTVPVLRIHDGTLLEESLEIMHWALNQYDPHGWLSSAKREEVEALIKNNDGPFKTHLDRSKYATRYPGVDAKYERSAACALLQPLEVQLKSEKYLLGGRSSLADVAIFPFVRQFANVEPQRFAQEFPELERWRQAWQENELFLQVMKKLPPWKPGAPPLSFKQSFDLA